MATTTTKPVDIKEFAIRVERLCDFLLDKIRAEVGRDGSSSQALIEDIKEQAADIHTGRVTTVSKTFEDLVDYMNGAP